MADEEAPPPAEEAPVEEAPAVVAFAATAADVSVAEGGTAEALVTIAGGDGGSLVTCAGWTAAADGTNWKLSKKNVNMAEAGKVAFTAASGEETVSGTFAMKVGPAAPVAFDGKYPKGVAEEDAAFRANLRKVQKFYIPSKKTKEVQDIWTLLKSANPREYDKIGFEWGIKDLRKMLKQLANAKKNNKKTTSFPTKLDDTMSCNIGDKIMFNVTTANEAMNTKWFFNGKDIGNKARGMSKGCQRSIVIESATAEHMGAWSCQVGDDKTCCELFVRKPRVTIEKQFEDTMANAGGNAVFNATLSADHGRYKLLKDGIEFGTTDKIAVVENGLNITVTVLGCGADDAGFYQIKTNGGSSFGELLVSGPAPAPKAPFAFTVSGDVELSCELADEKATGKWFKNAKAVVENDRVKPSEEGTSRKLAIAMTDVDNGTYEFRTEGEAKPASSFVVTCGGLAASLGAAQASLTKGATFACTTKVDAKLSIAAGSGCGVKCGGADVSGDENRMKVEVSESASALVVESARVFDSGVYEFGDASCAFTVTDVPTAPGKPVISDLTDETCRLDWTPPQSNGGSAVTGYAIERKRKGEASWCRVAEGVTNHFFVLRRLVDGATYNVRVLAISASGESPESQHSEAFTPISAPASCSMFRTGKLSDNGIELKWNKPDEVGAAGISGYVIQLQILPGGLKTANPADAKDEAWKDAVAGYVDAADSAVQLSRLETGKNYMFRMCSKNSAGASSWTSLGPVCCAANVEEPKILLPRALKKCLKINVNEKLHLNVPFQGAPKPCVTWSKIVDAPAPEPVAPAEGEEAKAAEPAAPEKIEQALETYFTVRTAADSSVIFLRNAARHDTGTYKVKVQVQDLSAEATIDVAVVDIPSKPRKAEIVETVGSSVQLKWEPPKDSGNLDIIGYQVDKRDKRSGDKGDWYVVYDRVRHTYCNVDDLIIGNDYQFQIRAINDCGLGDGCATKDYATIAKETITYTKPVYPEMDFSIKPEFTSSLNNRKLMIGYSGTVTCSLKAHPRPKIRWFKNKMEIIDNPKYKMSWGQGIIQLEIRRARLGDAGTYMVIAENELGEVSQSCEVVVKEPVMPQK